MPDTDFMVDDPNWENRLYPLPHAVFVRLGNGRVEQTQTRAHLVHMLTDMQGVIIDEPSTGSDSSAQEQVVEEEKTGD
jgi:hypothetical protein